MTINYNLTIAEGPPKTWTLTVTRADASVVTLYDARPNLDRPPFISRAIKEALKDEPDPGCPCGQDYANAGWAIFRTLTQGGITA